MYGKHSSLQIQSRVTNIAGSEMTVQWYFRRIRKLFSQLSTTMRAVLPSNRDIVSSFVSSESFSLVEDLLSGLVDVDEWDDVYWEDDGAFIKFTEYVLDNEARIERNLHSVRYRIDEANILTIVAGEGRPEKVRLPCVLLDFSDVMGPTVSVASYLPSSSKSPGDCSHCDLEVLGR